MERFCSVCGKTIKELIPHNYENKCRRCLFQEKVAVSLPGRLEISVCKQCMRYEEGKDWINAGQKLERAVSSAVRRSIEIKNLEKPRVSITSSEMDPKRDICVSVKVSGEFLGEEVSIERTTSVHVLFATCRECSQRSGRYYESILQVRGEMSGAEKEAIAERVTRAVSPISFISEVKDLREGIDFYIGSASAAKRAANVVAEKFGGEILISSKLFGKDGHGKNVYRTNVSLRLPKFKEGDVVELNGRAMQILGIGVNRMSAFDLEDRKIVNVPVKSLGSTVGAKASRRGAVLGRKKDIVTVTVSEVVRGRVQVIDMKNYETLYFKVDIPLKVKDEVEIFRGNKDYLLKTKRE